MQYQEATQIEQKRKAEAARRRAAIVAAQEHLFDEPDRNPRQYGSTTVELTQAGVT